MRYEVKPDTVEAILYTGNNAYQVEEFLGKHFVEITDIADENVVLEHRLNVFDIETKQWLTPGDDTYIIRRDDESLEIVFKEDFEEKYQPVVIRLSPHLPTTTPGIQPATPWQPHWTVPNPVIGQLQRNVD